MLKKILGTTGTRLITAIITFFVVFINARALGSEGVGEIALIVLGITIILLISNFVGGGAMVYLVPRYDAFLLIVPSYFWAVFSAATGAWILNLTGLIPSKYLWHIMALSLIQALGAIHLNFMLGKEKIKEYNLITLLQFTVLITAVITFFYVLNHKEVLYYVYALYFAFGTTLLLSFFIVLSFVRPASLKGLPEILKQIIKYGTFVQFANLLQLANYRLGYYIIESYLGKASLGIYDVGNKLSEGVWLTGKSVSMVQYSKISNTKSKEFAVELTLRLLKFVITATALMLMVLLLLPESIFQFVFGKDFSGIHLVIKSLSPGILAISASMIFSHYFSGIGKHYHNAVSSAIGVIFTVIFGFKLIPSMGIYGAGITASISYSASMLYQWIVFIITGNVNLKKFIINKEDIVFFFSELKKLFITK